VGASTFAISVAVLQTLSPFVIAAALIALLVTTVLLLIYLGARRKRSRTEKAGARSGSRNFDTTLGEFHDMREALRPLKHTRTASRQDPRNPK